MAHDCPECGSLCYCDMDDTFMDLSITGEDCEHECQPEPDEPDDA